MSMKAALPQEAATTIVVVLSVDVASSGSEAWIDAIVAAIAAAQRTLDTLYMSQTTAFASNFT